MKLLLIDGTNLVMRMAGVPSFQEEEGPVLDAALSVAREACREIGATHCVVALDSTESERRSMHPPYKGQRERSSKPWIRPAFTRFAEAGFAVVEACGWEADDVIATLARRHGPHMAVAVLSADSDLLALQHVERWQYGRNAEPRFVQRDEGWIRQKFGVPSWLLEDFKALAGEPGDNVEGPFGKHCVAKARKLMTNDDGTFATLDVLCVEGVLTGEQERVALMAKHVLALRNKLNIPPLKPAECSLQRAA